jgi:group II intron reverse transcriptase/maturase
MTAVLSNRGTSSLWARFCEWITSTENRLYIGWFGVLMIPCLLTATSVFIIGFIAAPPVDIDGIREPVSGSLLYGNNISAPRSYDFGIRRSWIASIIHATTSLGRQVTETLEIASTDKSMLVKQYTNQAVRSLVGCESTILWKKLYYLKTFYFSNRLAQTLSGVSYHLKDDGYSLNYLTFIAVMMYAIKEDVVSSLLKKRVMSNRIPKVSILAVTVSPRVRRSHKTLGSSLRGRAQGSSNHKSEGPGSTPPKDDGGPVVPIQRSTSDDSSTVIDAVLGRGPGDSAKLAKDVSCSDTGNVLEFDPVNTKDEDLKTFIKKWTQIEKTYKRGYKVPNKLSKLAEIGIKHNKSTFKDLYSILYDPATYDLAYNFIKSKPGNMTPGADGCTRDNWGFNTIDSIIKKMRNESFQFSLAKVVEIPKPDGSMRKLKVAPPRDKVVQRAIAWILECIYEPTFSPNSFGFRPNMGCHDALKHVELKFGSARWFIEGDISKCFDEIDHDLLITILRRRIKDEKFIRLIRKALKAGYLDQWSVPQDNIVGTPQGSILSPLLCNIFMNEFDNFVIQELKPKFTRGGVRKQPPEYMTLVAQANYAYKRYKVTNDSSYLQKAKDLRKKFQSMPSVVINDDSYRRVNFVRYADDWLIGFAGPYSEAVQIRDLCRDFLTSIKLRLNLDKTLITASSTGCIFLGIHVKVAVNQERFKRNSSNLKQRASLGVRLNVPMVRLIKKLARAGYCSPLGDKALPRMALYAADKDEMVRTYNAILRGFLNYYSPCDNYQKVACFLFYILRSSLAKILAAKMKLKTVRAVLQKYGKFLQKDNKVRLLDWKDPSMKYPRFKLNGNSEPRIRALFRTASLTIRASNLVCINCSSSKDVEMHHVLSEL